MQQPAPDVTVVIPTAMRRGSLLGRALASVRAQRGVATDIVVVDDRPPGASPPSLGDDVRVVATGGPLGPGLARNAGTAVARAPWVAFLDDDDTWDPRKLARQLDVAEGHGPDVIVGCRYTLHVRGRVHGVLPRRRYRPGDDVSEWALCERVPFGRLGWIASSTLLAGTDLLRRCPFVEPPKGEDRRLVLQATRDHGAHFVVLDDALADRYVDGRTDHMSGRTTWRDMVREVEEQRRLFTPASASAAILTVGTRRAGAWRDYPAIVRAAFRLGRPRVTDLVASAGLVFTPRAPRARLSRAVARRRGRGPSGVRR